MNSIKLNGTGDTEATARTHKSTEALASKREAHYKPLPPQTQDAKDELKVSDHAAIAGKLIARVSELPDVRGERVDALRAQIQAGNYHPSATEIADAILKNGG